MNYVVVAIPYFILAMLVEFIYGKLARRQTYRLADTVNSLQLGTLSRLVDVLRLGFGLYQDEADVERLASLAAALD